MKQTKTVLHHYLGKTLVHSISGYVGMFIKENTPSFGSNVIIIQLKDGRQYFAPSREFRLLESDYTEKSTLKR